MSGSQEPKTWTDDPNARFDLSTLGCSDGSAQAALVNEIFDAPLPVLLALRTELERLR